MKDSSQPRGNGFLAKMARVFALLSTTTVLLMLLVILVGYFGRALRFSISGVTEATEFLVLIGIFLGFMYVQYRNTHIKMELFSPSFPPWLRAAVGKLSSLLALVFFSAIMYGGIIMVEESYAVGEYEVGLRSVPMWIVRLFIPIGSFGVILVAMGDLLTGIVNCVRRTSKQ